MTQSSYKLNGNSGGYDLRVAIELAFEAIQTSNAGATAPTKTFAFMPWADIASNLMKQRNSTNTAWLTVGPLDKPSFGTGDQVGDFKLSARVNLDKYFKCLAQEISRTTYAELFAEIGTIYGSGNGTTTFNLPDQRGRALVFPGQGAGLTNRTMGDRFGAETHQLTGNQNGYHGHGYTDNLHNHVMNPNNYRAAIVQSAVSGSSGGELATVGGGALLQNNPSGVNISILANGEGEPHNNIQPSLVVGNLWIRVLP